MSEAAVVVESELRLETEPVPRQIIDDLRKYVRKGQARLRRLTILEALGLLIAAPLTYLWMAFFVDNVVHLPMWGRVAASALFLGVLCWLALIVRRNWRRANLTEDEVALAIERRSLQGVQNRLINAIQLSRDPDAQDGHLRLAVVRENYTALQQLQLEQVAASQPAVLRIIAAAVTIVIGVAFWMYDGERFRNAATRLLLPLAEIAPVYDTVLSVSPGDVTISAGQDVELTIQIQGKVLPAEIFVLTRTGEDRSSEKIATAQASTVKHRFKAIRNSLEYAVRGNDYTSRWFKIEVPAPLTLERLKGVITYPPYSRLPSRTVDSISGDLEALQGATAALTFTFNEPLESAVLLLERPAAVASKLEPAAAKNPVGEAAKTDSAVATQIERIPLKKSGTAEYTADLTFANALGYQIEMKAGQREVRSPRFALRVIPDLPPTLELTGVEPTTPILMDSVLPLVVAAHDDLGLQQVELVYRRVKQEKGKVEVKVTPLEDWQSIKQWTVEKQALEARFENSLPLGALNVAEGESMELAARARDTDPGKAGEWTLGTPLRLLIHGAGVELQLKYEQILKSEADIKTLIKSHEALFEIATQWSTKLGPTSGLRWDDQKNLDALAAAVKDLSKREAAVRAEAAGIAHNMPEDSGNLKLSVGLLADTEMVRAIQILESVPRKDTVQEKRRALGDARLTVQRVIRSTEEIRDAYISFRKDWELSHMLAFVKMLGERETSMADASLTYAGMPAGTIGDVQQKSISRRQTKLLDLTKLAQTAYLGMHDREELVGPVMAESFKLAAQAFDARDVKSNMQKSLDPLAKGAWIEAEPLQRLAAEGLTAIYNDLRKAQAQAGKEALNNLKLLGDSSVEDQKDIEQLKPGSQENSLDLDPDKLNLSEIVHLRATAADKKKGKHEKGKDKVENYLFDEALKASLTPPGTGKKQDFNILKLAEKPTGEMKFPNSSDREANKVKPNPQKEMEDLVGKLLDEADDMKEEFETYNINTTFEINEPGEVGKQGGDLNSTAAASATGNMKPPTNNFGGAARSGRQGARSHGAAVGDKSINRKGREEAQEGQEDAPNQAGELKEVKSDDPMEDASTGRGGKATSNDKTSYSTKDAGEFKEEDVKDLRAPQDTQRIVERKGKPLDPRLAEQMRDLNSHQEQLIERIKAVKKQLDQLYLPTDHLDDIMAQLNQNLDRLKDKPEADLFRKQVELLDKLKSTVVVFNRPTSEFEQSLKREQTVKGRILDEPAKQTLPGYEEAVNRYYEKLSGL